MSLVFPSPCSLITRSTRRRRQGEWGERSEPRETGRRPRSAVGTRGGRTKTWERRYESPAWGGLSCPSSFALRLRPPATRVGVLRSQPLSTSCLSASRLGSCRLPTGSATPLAATRLGPLRGERSERDAEGEERVAGCGPVCRSLSSSVPSTPEGATSSLSSLYGP